MALPPAARADHHELRRSRAVRPERAGTRDPAVRGRPAARSDDRERARQPRGCAQASAPARPPDAALVPRDRPAGAAALARARGEAGAHAACRGQHLALHDRARRGGDARGLPRVVSRGSLGDDRRRHRLERPDGGDRRVVRCSRAALRVDGQLRRGAQRRRRRGDRRLDPLARRRRAARAGRCAAARRAHARAVARGALARRDQLHGTERGGDGIAAPRPPALAEPAPLPLLACDPRADPQLDAV